MKTVGVAVPAAIATSIATIGCIVGIFGNSRGLEKPFQFEPQRPVLGKQFVCVEFPQFHAVSVDAPHEDLPAAAGVAGLDGSSVLEERHRQPKEIPQRVCAQDAAMRTPIFEELFSRR